MNIYKDYIQTIKSAMAVNLNKAIVNNFDGRKQINMGQRNLSENALLPSLDEFARELGRSVNFEQQLGLHPDFAHLKNSEATENHYIVSMFIDIKGSTNLFRKYNPATVLLITHAIQKAAIHTCLIFGGYIHRLQGDGLFVYFGGKNINKSDAVLRSLQCSSTFTYFVKNDLKELLNEQGIEDINTRIGIDLGHDEDVVWGMAGIGEISEVTTCSLHTSLACKMQASAISNGIVVGDHIKNQIASLQEFYLPVANRKGENERYIFRIPEKEFNYTQHDFNWLSFLKKQDFIVTDLYGKLGLKRKLTQSVKSSENLKQIAVLSKPSYNL